MRSGRVIATVAALALAGAAPASATTWPVTGATVRPGPRLAGDGAVWNQARGQGYALVRGHPDGTTTTLAQSSDQCAFLEQLAASPTRIAAIVRQSSPQTGGCGDPTAITLLAGPPDGPLTPLQALGGPGRACTPDAVDLDGDRLLVAFLDCSDERIVVRDLASPDGAETVVPNAPFVDFGRPIRLRGTHAAAVVTGFRGAAQTAEARVFDVADGHVDATIDLADLMGHANVVNFDSALALDADGTLVAAVPDYGGNGFGLFPDEKIAWASPTEPTAHEVSLGARTIAVSLDGGKVSVTRATDQSVVDLRTGQPQSTFGYGMGASDFRDGRIAWSDDTGVHAEAYPHDPGPRPPAKASPFVLPPTSGVKGKKTPIVHLTSTPTTVRSRRLTALTGTASDADGRIAAVQVAVVRRRGRRCSQLTAHRRLKRIAHGCTPSVALKASGTRHWRLRLTRRLPAGRYSVLAAARDDSGLIGRATRALRVLR